MSETRPISPRHDLILQSVTDGVLVIDLQKRILYANRNIAGIYGLEPSDLIGKSCEEVIGFDHCASCPHAAVLDENEPFTGHNLRCEHCSTGPYCVSAAPYRDEAGDVIGIVEIYRDMRALGAYIDDMEQTNIQLHHERQRLDDILTDSSDGYFTASLDRTILSADAKLLKLLGKRSEEVVGQSCDQVLCSDKCDSDCPILWAREHGENVIGSSDQIQTSEGPVPVEKSIFLHKDPAGNVEHVIGVIRNAAEIVELRRKTRLARGFSKLVSANVKMERVFELIRTFGPTDAAVLILGESGTGKELVARALQEISPRRDRPYLKINCSALAEGLLESELFGHVRGAFTGADQHKRGLFEVADGGTLFLDEVGDMSPKLQTKILRVLEEQEFERVGGTESIKANVRIIAATNRDLDSAIAEGDFREDLYYRLNAIQIKLPPLRERREDIPLLVERFLVALNRTHDRGVERISARALELLQRYSWPGNVRELRNAIEFAYVCALGDRVERQDLPEQIRSPRLPGIDSRSLEGLDEAGRLQAAMQQYNGNRNLVAQVLGISRTTLWRRLKKYEL
ncbi:MAG: sigma 54-interacting transcriptional regulator [bacterium]